MEIPRVALPAPWARMLDVADEAMLCIVEEAQHRRRVYAASNPKGRQGFAPAGLCCSSLMIPAHRQLLAPCQRTQIPGARLHAISTTDS